MKRRDFLAATGIAGLSTTMLSSLSGAELNSNREFIELRTYTVKDDTKKALLIETLDKAFIPAVNAQGIKPVGVLVPLETEKDFDKNVFVVIPHKSLDSYLNLTPKLLANENYLKTAAFFAGNSKDPVYETCEIALLKGFEHCPKLKTPELGPDRVFHLRIYRSFNIERAAAKVHMFDHGGEMELFRELGIMPIFFGDALSGTRLPNLTYMVAGKSVEQHNQDWKTFAGHPKWKEISKNPAYADTATQIAKVLLKPSAGSQF